MSRFLVAILVITGALATWGALAQEPAPDPGRGARLYSDNCARCHNYRAPTEFGDREWSVVMAHMRVVAGLPGDQARAIEEFLRTSNNPPRPELPPVGAGPAAPDPAERATHGAQLIERYACRGCHVIDGAGGAAGPSLDGLSERRDARWVREQIRTPRKHNPDSVMPELGISEAEAAAIVEALRVR